MLEPRVMPWSLCGRAFGVWLAVFLLTPFAAGQDLDATLDPVRAMIERFEADQGSIRRFYDAPVSRGALDLRAATLAEWEEALRNVDFDALNQDGRVDYLLFGNLLKRELAELGHERAKTREMAGLIPFADAVVELHETRRALQTVDGEVAAELLSDLSEQLDAVRASLKGEPDPGYTPIVANRAAGATDALRRTLREWYEFSAGYDPVFTWWAKAPYETLDGELRDYATFLRRELAGIKDGEEGDAIIGDPIGREALIDALRFEMIPYSPEELIAIAEREYAWCLAEMLEASRALGYGEDWRSALEHVKELHVAPGEQPALIRDLAYEAVDFIESRGLVTVPELCKETWRMEMMSPARQKVSPYFLGGETILVSFPTDGMEHGDKLMSMRGNNRHFSRATVQHELIPGHHLQGFMIDRYRTHRRAFRTPFWIEGWALYWEMLLWDLDFPQSAEDRVGMLFWRMHRCARIVFSLRFHLGEMTPEEAIDYLVERVGHERNNATAEVRRSVSGSYGPLYQAAYMLGGLQIRALRQELVESGRMSDRAFHDAILRLGPIPVEMVRATLTDQELTRECKAEWRFADE